MARALVVGSNQNTNLGIVRALGEAGHEVHLLVLNKGKRGRMPRFDAASRYIASVLTCRMDDDEGLVAKINALSKDEDPLFVFPSVDVATVMIDRNLNKLENVVAPSVCGEQGMVEFYSDKFNQIELAKKAGLDVPWSRKVEPGDDIEVAIEGVPYPCFCKSIARYSGGKEYMQVCKDANELAEYLAAAAKERQAILVQELLDVSCEYDLAGVGSESGAWVPLALTKLQASQGSHHGITLKARVYPSQELGDVAERIEKFVELMEYRGVFDVDMLEANGRIYFCEMNLRPGTTTFGFTSAGANLPAAFVRAYFDGALEPAKEAAQLKGLTFCNDYTLAQEVSEKAMTKGDAKKLLSSCDVRLVQNSNDPAPGRTFLAANALKGLKKSLHPGRRG